MTIHIKVVCIKDERTVIFCDPDEVFQIFSIAMAKILIKNSQNG